MCEEPRKTDADGGRECTAMTEILIGLFLKNIGL
jgi:hypothetical protein